MRTSVPATGGRGLPSPPGPQNGKGRGDGTGGWELGSRKEEKEQSDNDLRTKLVLLSAMAECELSRRHGASWELRGINERGQREFLRRSHTWKAGNGFQ